MRKALRALRVGVAALALVLPLASVPARAAAVTGSATLEAAPDHITFGDGVELTGETQADQACLADRPVSLEEKRADQAEWTAVAEGTTGPDGSFSFSQAPQFSVAFRVVLPETTAGAVTCDPITSNPAPVDVAAKVDAELASDRIRAGDCVDMTVSVQPDKGGQVVQIERRSGQEWTALATPSLDPSSSVTAPLCFAWADIGTVRLRAGWVAQDELNTAGATPRLPLDVVMAPWMERIQTLVTGRAVSVSVGQDGEFLYRRADGTPRIPASNEKLLLSMALLDELGPDYRIVTRAAAPAVRDGVVQGNLWIEGRGDPTMNRGRLGALAQQIADAGIRKVKGSVMGDTGYFRHDWWAPGWASYFPRDFIALPTALTYEGNAVGGVHVRDPERRAAAALTQQLESRGVAVVGDPGAGRPAGNLTEVAEVRSAALSVLLTKQNRKSLNLSAEVLGKLLGVRRSGPPGTIAKGAAAVAAWTEDRGVPITAYDCSGLSYNNRVTAEGIVRLLWAADDAPWGPTLRDTLPGPDQGTLRDRLDGVRIRAKTGTLTEVSALSGWVWLQREEAWAEFSILSQGMSKDRASDLEDAIVRTLWRNAH